VSRWSYGVDRVFREGAADYTRDRPVPYSNVDWPLLCEAWPADELETGMADPRNPHPPPAVDEWGDYIGDYSDEMLDWIQYFVWVKQTGHKVEWPEPRPGRPRNTPPAPDGLGRCAQCNEPVIAGISLGNEPCWPGGTLYHHTCWNYLASQPSKATTLWAFEEDI